MIIRFGLAFALLTSALPPVSAAPFHHSFGEWRDYNQDWLAACPDTIDEDANSYYGYSCFASTGTAQHNAANLPAYKITLVLNRLTGKIDISFIAAATDGTEIDQSRQLIIRVADRPDLGYDFANDLEIRDNTSNQYFVKGPARSAELLEIMKARAKLTLIFPIMGDKSPVQELNFSLRGVTASLDFMASYARKLAQY